jgi:hypothetical protein
MKNQLHLLIESLSYRFQNGQDSMREEIFGFKFQIAILSSLRDENERLALQGTVLSLLRQMVNSFLS